MPTLEQWKAYKTYVGEYNKEVEDFNRKSMAQFTKVVVIKHKFLWWEWETELSPSSNRFGFVPYLKDYKKPSLEECLDWLVEQN